MANTPYYTKAETDAIEANLRKQYNYGASEYQGYLEIADTPTLDGWYWATQIGTYTNAGGLVTVANKINMIEKDGVTFRLNAIDVPVTTVVDGFASNSTTSAGSANNDRLLNENILGAFDAVDITKTQVTDFNANIAVNVTTLFQVVNLLANVTYTIQAQTTDALPSGLDFWVTLPSYAVIREFEPTDNFLSGVSFVYTPTVNCSLQARTFVSGKNIVFTVSHNEYSSPVGTLYPIVSNVKVIDYLNFTPSTTTVYLYSEFSKYAGKTLTGNITAQYTGTFTIYGTVNGVFTTIYNVASTNFASGFNFTLTIPIGTTEIMFRFWQTTSLVNNVTLFNPEITPSYLPFGGNQWNNKVVALYGDSITAISNGDFTAPIQTTINPANWGIIVGKILNLSKVFGRGIGGQKYAFGTAGGSVAFINADGTLHSRSDAYNLDNYAGNIPLPSGTTAVRGSYSSWIRIKTMFPASIKNTIDAVIVMGGTNDVVDATEVSWVAGSTVDAEWASSTEYATYGGDYNLNTLEGGMASTILKFQAWMPNTRFIFATPLGGRSTTGALNLASPITQEYTKSITIRRLANIFSIPLIDINAEAGVNGVNTNIYLADGIHPYNTNGNKALAMGFLGGLRKIFPRL